jgi:hypothetical protein
VSSIRNVLAALALCALLPTAAAQASTSASIKATFSSNRLGSTSSVTLTANLRSPDGVPARLTKSVVRLPAGLGIASNGAQICSLAALRSRGLGACPRGSQVGGGSALLDVMLGSEPVSESATLTAFRIADRNGHTAFAISGQGLTPLYERVTFSSTVLPDSGPYSRQIVTAIPGIPTLRGEPDASVLKYSLTFGGRVRITVPRSCPAGGFRFGSDFTFADGSSTTASATTSCP